MKTYNNFNDMFNANSNTNKNLSVFNAVPCITRMKNGYETGTFTVQLPGYGKFCSVFYDDSPVNGFYDGSYVFYADTLDGGIPINGTTSWYILGGCIKDMLLDLPDIKILGRDNVGGIVCSRSLTKEEARGIAYKLNHIFINEAEKERDAWDKRIAMD